MRASGKRSRRRLSWGPLLKALQDHYSSGTWRVPVLRERGADPFHVLVSTVLSHRTGDATTLRAFRRLHGAYPNTRSMAQADPRRVEEIIRPVGLSTSKAGGLVRMAQQIEGRFGGAVPPTYDELVSLPMVGPKTASAVEVFAFGRDAIPVDTHIHRVVNRLGAVTTATPEETRMMLTEVVPRRYWGLLNPVLVQHGQNLCSARAPRCGDCPVRPRCSYGSKCGLTSTSPRRRA